MFAFRYVDRDNNEQRFKNEIRLENILKNERMLLSHTRNANFINRIRASMYKLAHSNKTNKHDHKENQTGRWKADEKGVQDLVNCFVEFECDPLDSTHSVVTTLHSG